MCFHIIFSVLLFSHRRLYCFSLDVFQEDLEFEDEDDDDEDGFPSDLDLYKMVFVVNMDLGMGVGKVAAQVAHAALGLHRLMIDNTGKWGEMMISWEQYG